MGAGRFDLDPGAMERLLEEAREHRGESLWQDARRRLRRNRPAWYALLFLSVFALTSFLAPLLPLRSPVLSDLDHALEAPSLDGGDSTWLAHLGEAPEEKDIERAYWQLSGLDHALLRARRGLFGTWQTGTWLGTDHLGRDLLSRIVWGSRTSILVALAATLCSLMIGVFYGSLSALLGGRLDNLMMRIVDILYSVPFIFVVIFLITLIGDHRETLEQQYGLDREKVFYLVIGAVYWLPPYTPMPNRRALPCRSTTTRRTRPLTMPRHGAAGFPLLAKSRPSAPPSCAAGRGAMRCSPAGS